MSKRKSPVCANCATRLLKLPKPQTGKMEDGRTFTVTHRCRTCNIKVGIRKETSEIPK